MTGLVKEVDMSKVLLGAIAGLLAWNIYTTHKLSIDVAVIHYQVGEMKELLSDVQDNYQQQP